jgi:hypothetical protein
MVPGTAVKRRREVMFGFRDTAHERCLQDLLTQFLTSIEKSDAVHESTQVHVSNTNKIDINPYRPARGEAVKAQLFHANVAEWGPLILQGQSKKPHATTAGPGRYINHEDVVEELLSRLKAELE